MKHFKTKAAAAAKIAQLNRQFPVQFLTKKVKVVLPQFPIVLCSFYPTITITNSVHSLLPLFLSLLFSLTFQPLFKKHCRSSFYLKEASRRRCRSKIARQFPKVVKREDHRPAQSAQAVSQSVCSITCTCLLVFAFFLFFLLFLLLLVVVIIKHKEEEKLAVCSQQQQQTRNTHCDVKECRENPVFSFFKAGSPGFTSSLSFLLLNCTAKWALL